MSTHSKRKNLDLKGKVTLVTSKNPRKLLAVECGGTSNLRKRALAF